MVTMLHVRALVVGATIVCPACASAGGIEQAVVVAQPQMQVKNGQVEGCGARLVGAVTSGSRIEAIDASFNLYADGMALLKAGSLTSRASASGQQPPAVVNPITAFWLKPQGGDPTKPAGGKFIGAETPGYLLAGAESKEISALFTAVFERQQILLSVRRKTTSVDQIFSGPVDISDAELQQISSCLADLDRQNHKNQAQPPAK